MALAADAGTGVDSVEGVAPGHGPSKMHADAGEVVDSGVVAVTDAQVGTDTQTPPGVDSQSAIAVDAKSIVETTPISCVQQIINNGYSTTSYFADGTRLSCDTCVGALLSDAGSMVSLLDDAGVATAYPVNVSHAAECRAAFDCFAAHWPCDKTCFDTCKLNFGVSAVGSCVLNIGGACTKDAFPPH
jgi:hypothetical protein